jgi:hypothetical protein
MFHCTTIGPSQLCLGLARCGSWLQKNRPRIRGLSDYSADEGLLAATVEMIRNQCHRNCRPDHQNYLPNFHVLPTFLRGHQLVGLIIEWTPWHSFFLQAGP